MRNSTKLLLLTLLSPLFVNANTDLRVNLTLSPSGNVTAKTKVTITCTLEKDISMKEIRISLANNQAAVSWNTKEMKMRNNSVWQKQIIRGYCTIEKKTLQSCPGSTSLTLDFTASPKWNGTVKCFAITKYNAERGLPAKIGSAAASLNVYWLPHVRDLRVAPERLMAGKNATISCEMIFGSQRSRPDSGFMISNGTWIDLKDENGTTPDGYLYVIKKRRKTLKAIDNGKKVSCAIGNSKKELYLNVTYAPNITKFLPSNNNSIVVGSPIRCSVDANPPADVTINFKKVPSSWEEARGVRKAEFMVSNETEAGNYEAKCEAENEMGKSTEERSLLVKKRPLLVTFEVGDTLQVGVPQKISCSAPDPHLYYIRVEFQQGELLINKYPPNQITVAEGNKDWKKIKSLPYNISNVMVEKPVAHESINVTLHPQPNYDGTSVICEAVSERKFGKVGRELRTLTVSWKPSVRKVTVSDVSGTPNTVTEDAAAVVRCELQLGGPAKQRSSVRTKVGQKELHSPLFRFVEMDHNGFRWIEASWKTTMWRQENGAVVKCLSGDISMQTSVQVLYAPRHEDIDIQPSHDELFVGDFVNCSASGNPVPKVIVEVDPKGTIWKRSSTTGFGVATFRIPKNAHPGNFSFKCSAENKIGKQHKSATKVVNKNPLPISLTAPNDSVKVDNIFIIGCGPRYANVTLSSVQLFFRHTGPGSIDSTEMTIAMRKHRREGNINESFGFVKKTFDNTSQTLKVKLRASAMHLGTVRCRIQSSDEARVGITERSLSVHWPSKVPQLQLRRQINASYTESAEVFIENQTIEATCEVNVGYPAVEKPISLRGSERLGPPTYGPNFTRKGQIFRSVVRTLRVTPDDDRKVLNCSFNENVAFRTLNVSYSPRNVSLSSKKGDLYVGDSVSCSALGNPLPRVTVRVELKQRISKLWPRNSSEGSGKAALRIPKEASAGSYIFVCSAKNKVGSTEERAIKVIGRSSLAFLYALLALIPIFILAIICGHRRIQTSASKNFQFPLIMQHQSELTADTTVRTGEDTTLMEPMFLQPTAAPAVDDDDHIYENISPRLS